MNTLLLVSWFALRFCKLHNLAGGGLEDLTLSTSSLNCFFGRLGKGMGLHGNVLGSEVVSSHNDLMYIVLGLGHDLALQQGIDCIKKRMKLSDGKQQGIGK